MKILQKEKGTKRLLFWRRKKEKKKRKKKEKKKEKKMRALKILCPRFEMKKPGSCWYGDTQIPRESSVMINGILSVVKEENKTTC